MVDGKAGGMLPFLEGFGQSLRDSAVTIYKKDVILQWFSYEFEILNGSTITRIPCIFMANHSKS